MNKNWKDFLKLCGGLFLLYLAIHYWPAAFSLIKAVFSAAFPLLLGCVIAYLVNILMSFYERIYFPKAKNPLLRASRRPVCMTGAFATLVAIVAFVIYLIVPQLISCVQLIIAKVPGFIRDALALMDEWNVLPDDIIATLSAIDWNSRIDQMLQVVTSGMADVMSVVVSTVSHVFSGVVTAVVSIIFSFYILNSKEKLCSQSHRVMQRYLKASWCEKTEYVLGVLDHCFHRYIVGQCIEALILGLLCMLGMMLLRLPYATMIGALIAFTALIPIAGAYIGAFIGAFMILTVNPLQALIFLVFLVILQQVEGNLIYPRVVGSSMGLPGLWVLAAVTVGGGIMGILGMLLGVPLAAAAYRLIREDVNRGLKIEAAEESQTE